MIVPDGDKGKLGRRRGGVAWGWGGQYNARGAWGGKGGGAESFGGGNREKGKI